MHFDGNKATNGFPQDSVFACRLMQRREPMHAVSDHGDGVPAHCRLQFPHVDKDTILTLEHAERLVNSAAFRSMVLLSEAAKGEFLFRAEVPSADVAMAVWRRSYPTSISRPDRTA